jgi:hypothetical protein
MQWQIIKVITTNNLFKIIREEKKEAKRNLLAYQSIMHSILPIIGNIT